MRVLYIVGPFSAANTWEIERNVRRAEEVALELWKMGAAVICPHTNTRFFHGAESYGQFLAGGLELLARADGVVLLPDWPQSPGGRMEINRAIAGRLPLFLWPTSLEAIKKFIQGPRDRQFATDSRSCCESPGPVHA